jgi:hypothetical protein
MIFSETSLTAGSQLTAGNQVLKIWESSKALEGTIM